MKRSVASSLAALIALFAMGGGLFCNGCRRTEFWPGPSGPGTSKPKPPPGPPGTLQVRARPPGPHPRVLLTAERLGTLAVLKDTNSPSWKSLLEQCRAARKEDIHAGYEAWDWGNAALALAICSKVAKEPEFGAAGVRYFTALLDDKETVGDGQGGDAVVHHDDGYSMRTHGWLGAIAYDWLYDAPGMTPELKKRAMDRFAAWTAWFKQDGFSHDQAISNYYASYFGTVAFAGIACEGDDPRADALRAETQRMWNDEIVPTYHKLAGGDFPEGWQYGDLVGALLAIYAEAENTSHPVGRSDPPPKPLWDDLPWLREVPTFRAHALWPDGKHMYDNGDWSEKPAVAPPHTLFALSTILPATDPAGRQATFLARLARDDSHEEWKWLQVLADDPTRPADDPRKGQASYLARGTATMFARSDWSPNALWVSLTSEPTLSDHEHLDAGHFEVVRGGDWVLLDGGGYGSPSSLSHNVVIVDDPQQSSDWETSRKHHDVITYKKQQGTWSDTANIARFEDGGRYVYALADYASAWNPSGWPQRKDRAVTRAERELLFSRAPVTGAGSGGETGRVVVYDRFTTSAPRFTTTFVLHGGAAPQITGPVARFTTGQSSAWVTTLLPTGATANVVDETNNKESDDRPYFTNKPPDGATSFRYEVPTPAGPPSTERRFLHAIVIGPKELRTTASTVELDRSAPVRIDGDLAAGAAIDGEAYVFSSVGPAPTPAAFSYLAPTSAARHVVADLAPSGQYTVTATPNGDRCKIAFAPGAGGKTASPQGVIVLDVASCTVR